MINLSSYIPSDNNCTLYSTTDFWNTHIFWKGYTYSMTNYYYYTCSDNNNNNLQQSTALLPLCISPSIPALMGVIINSYVAIKLLGVKQLNTCVWSSEMLSHSTAWFPSTCTAITLYWDTHSAPYTGDWNLTTANVSLHSTDTLVGDEAIPDEMLCKNIITYSYHNN